MVSSGESTGSSFRKRRETVVKVRENIRPGGQMSVTFRAETLAHGKRRVKQYVLRRTFRLIGSWLTDGLIYFLSKDTMTTNNKSDSNDLNPKKTWQNLHHQTTRRCRLLLLTPIAETVLLFHKSLFTRRYRAQQSLDPQQFSIMCCPRRRFVCNFFS